MNIKKLYNELLATSIILNFFDALLTAIMIFSISYFLVYFYRVSYLFGVGLSVLFFLRSFYSKIKSNKILILEDKYPDLKMRLRTSYDYQQKSNTIIDSLHHDIAKYMIKVDVNAYLSMKKIIGKVLLICILFTTTLYFSSIGLDILDITNRVVHSTTFTKVSGFIKDITAPAREFFERPLLNDPKLLDLGQNEVNFSIESYNTEIDISNIEEPEKSDYGGHYPEEIQGAAQETYEEGIPDEDKNVIKEYFEKINKDS